MTSTLRRRLGVLAAAALLALAAAPAVAQIIPGRPQPGRPARGAPQRPQGRAAGDTVPGDSTRRREVPEDSTINALLRLPGYDPVEYQGDSAQFNNRERTLRLRGNPVVSQGTTRLEARDSIVYRERSDFVEVYGRPQVTGAQQDISGEVMYYDLGSRRAAVRNARTTITEGATWYVQGNVTSEEEGTRVYATRSTFTSDDREEPAYYFRADRIKVIKNRVLVGRPAYLYFRNVPVFVLPFIVQDLSRGRRSGFLIPEFEVNDIIRTDQRGGGTRGTGRQISNIGYYWAINDYMGAQAALDWRSQSWIGLNVGYQFNVRRRFLSGNASLTRFWREGGNNSFNLQGSGTWKPNERTDLSTALNYSSNTSFERNRQVDPFRQLADISSTVSVRRQMDWGDLTAGGELRQSISTGDNNLRTRLSISPQTITLFPVGEDGRERWYNEGSLTVTADGSVNRTTPGEALARRQQSSEDEDASLSTSIRLGNVGVSGGLRYNRQYRNELAAIDSAAAIGTTTPAQRAFLPGFGTQTLDWNAATGYEFRLIGATRLTPNISIGQQVIRRDTAFDGGTAPDSIDGGRYGTFVAAPLRTSLSANLQTELFGFFPGIGPYSAIRHHFRPGFAYSYTPAVRQTPEQELVFGQQGGREVNQLTLNLDQTFEAKLRAPRRESATDRGADRAGTGNPQGADEANPGAQTDTAAAQLTPGDPTLRDSTGAETAGGRPSGGAGQQDQKITLLAINTSALAYSFVPVDTFGTRFTTPDITNRIRSDLFGGLNFTISHDLFEEQRGETGGSGGVGRRGRFSPFLTGVQTSLSFGANSALFRWLGFSRGSEEERRTERGQTPPEQGQPTLDPPGSQTQTNSPVPGFGAQGGGAWNVQLNYSLRRSRPVRGGIPTLETDENQQVSGSLSFMPTRNWAVSWYTDYSISENKFGTHVLNFKRDLYRWQANFDFRRAPNGNTSFSFSVHLTDLPDLKADYNRSNLGADRPEQ
ncbi:putative LPS assembly protein LptD [Longimicrobium sp.]|uniref:putative LPS assembly protein LptD n=1 Tax=Longimicrobium sp. TaxID=2029185 RepID=UPI002E316F17|nr:putative LPS assembly protein LptD [Longimicrobium sp.]HEX6040639.1 putative LPS assembly protein LptD [Longimicrobium sp.]